MAGPAPHPEPVLGETCNFLRNNVRNGPALEVRFLSAVVSGGTGFQIVDPVAADRERATELAEKLVSGPRPFFTRRGAWGVVRWPDGREEW